MKYKLIMKRYGVDKKDATKKVIYASSEKIYEKVVELASEKDGYFDAKNHKVYDIIRAARQALGIK